LKTAISRLFSRDAITPLPRIFLHATRHAAARDASSRLHAVTVECPVEAATNIPRSVAAPPSQLSPFPPACRHSESCSRPFRRQPKIRQTHMPARRPTPDGDMSAAYDAALRDAHGAYARQAGAFFFFWKGRAQAEENSGRIELTRSTTFSHKHQVSFSHPDLNKGTEMEQPTTSARTLSSPPHQNALQNNNARAARAALHASFYYAAKHTRRFDAADRPYDMIPPAARPPLTRC